jgi:hypothetical protein
VTSDFRRKPPSVFELLTPPHLEGRFAALN